ncbi:hypothetical protein KXX16_001609 [Aspergillus fumigatus]|nr:hypothetical protein KXX31_007859 [Aspergillus fumigatus]KAH1644821.1 hypothetical protein KXX16_001609 [Aspergillus fumigatus]KAH1835565.1 hypothetical protein KXX43_003298 [Aspergillus fumigatus]KAH1918086.1 hypothetical protein KXW47_000793 [Aspergillus fumigatus]KAH2281901.1 hypothetical protein KXW02_004797 [Aspergillus fumigatus]
MFLQKEVYRLGSEPGLRSLPPGPERDFLTLTWGPIVYRTTYAPDSQRLIPIFLRALNEEIQKALSRCLSGSPEQIRLLETTYASKVFNSQEGYDGLDEETVRESFHDWKVALALPAIELPVRLRMCLMIDEGVLSRLTTTVDMSSMVEEDADYSSCPVKVIEENFPDVHRRDSKPTKDDYPGWTKVALSAIVEVYDDGCRMDRFISRKRPRPSPSAGQQTPAPDEDSTDMKLAMLLSLFPDIEQDALLDILISSGGSVEDASAVITAQRAYKPVKKRAGGVSAIQTSMTSHITTEAGLPPKRQLTRKGKTLHLFSPEDVAAHTPCSIIHNFLPPDEADALLLELLDESKHFSRYRFQLFDRTVESPHTSSLYVATPEEIRQQTSEYTYGGRYRSNVRQLTPYLRAVSAKVQRAVNDEVQKRIRACYPGGKKLKYQSPKEWVPNAAFVNCYDGPAESVGYHSDELTYLGPRAIIGSLSLGVEREFRVRRIVASDDDAENNSEVSFMVSTADSPSRRKTTSKGIDGRGDAQGQISIHLPHNSLLVMHAEMQEEWKHAIVPAQTVSPHPLSGNRRINITYRWYRDSLHPRNIPRCRCGTHAILRCVQRKRENKGRYMWMCYAGHEPGKKGCTFFQWAEFDDDGEPLWEIKPTEGGAPTLRNFIEEDDKQ